MGLGLDVSPIAVMMGQNDPSHLLRVIVVLPLLLSLLLSCPSLQRKRDCIPGIRA